MNRVVTAFASLGVAMCVARGATAAVLDPAPVSKRQVAEQVLGCMRRRMAVDRHISYNDAAKACREQVSLPRGNPATGALVAADTPSRP